MLTLLIFFVFLVLVLSVVGRIARASRRRAYEEEQRRLEESRRRGGEEPVSPFAGMPFGGLFEEMFRGIETRSYRIDPDLTVVATVRRLDGGAETRRYRRIDGNGTWERL